MAPIEKFGQPNAATVWWWTTSGRKDVEKNMEKKSDDIEFLSSNDG